MGFGAGDSNLYRYAMNAPTDHADSSGMAVDESTIIVNSQNGAAGSFAAGKPLSVINETYGPKSVEKGIPELWRPTKGLKDFGLDWSSFDLKSAKNVNKDTGSATYTMNTTKGTPIDIYFWSLGSNCHGYSVGASGIADPKGKENFKRVPPDIQKAMDATIKIGKGGGSFVLNPDQMKKVLSDGYELIGTDLSKAEVGDLVVYVKDNVMIHSCRIIDIKNK
jgi:hypothetical protein